MNEAKQWRLELLNMLDSLDMRDWTALDMAHSVERVKTVRQQDLSRLVPSWNGDGEDDV